MSLALSRVCFSRTMFSVSARVLNVSPSFPPFGISRLGPSKRVPGTTGVFCTCSVKKFVPIQILPDALRSMPSDKIHQIASFLETGVVSRLSSSTKVSPAAPPYVENLVSAPRKTVSLRRFIALRAAFSSDRHLYVPTAGGWYLLLPSKAVPFQDPFGLKIWLQQHHPRYRDRIPSEGKADASDSDLRRERFMGRLGYAAAQVRRKALALHDMEELEANDKLTGRRELKMVKHESSGDDGLVLSLKSRNSLNSEGAGNMERCDKGHNAEVDDSNEDGQFSLRKDTTLELTERSILTDKMSNPERKIIKSSPLRPSTGRKQKVPYITEEHLFEINDGVHWELPPSEDLAQPEYWRQHRSRMALYEEEASALWTVERDEFIQDALRGLRTPPAEAMVDPTAEPPKSKETVERMRAQQHHINQLLHERKALLLGERLFQVLTQKANVRLNVDDEMGLVTLVPIVDLNPGDELLLHYGREWWTQRLLSRLFLSAQDSDMPTIRWIESLCRSEDGTDVFEPFPSLVPARKIRKKAWEKIRNEEGSTMASLSENALYNHVTRKEATDTEVLMFAIRRSCQDHAFFKLLMHESNDGVPPLFCQETCNSEVPLKFLRRVLLRNLIDSVHGITLGDRNPELLRLPENAAVDSAEFRV